MNGLADRRLARMSTRARAYSDALPWVLDWVIIALGASLIAVVKRYATGNRQLLTQDILDAASFPQLHNTVPGWTTFTVTWMVPVGVFLVLRWCRQTHSTETHQYVRSLLAAIVLTGLCSQMFKLQIGRPRPSFADRCYKEDSTLPAPVQRILGATLEAACTNPDASAIKNAYRSFASGHAAYHAAGFGFLSLVLLHKSRVFDGNGSVGVTAACMLPSAWAVWVGLTRVSDYAHHASDVLAGLLLGAFWALLMFVQAVRALRPEPEPVPVFSVDAKDFCTQRSSTQPLTAAHSMNPALMPDAASPRHRPRPSVAC